MCNFYDYWIMLEKTFASSTMKVVLLMMLSVIYPVFADRGLMFTSPILVCLSSDYQLRAFVKVLDIFGLSSIKTLAVSPKKFETLMNAGGHPTFITRFIKSRYTEENLALLEQSCCELNKRKYSDKLRIVLTIGGVPSEYLKWFAGSIYINGNERGMIKSGQDYLARKIIRLLETQELEMVPPCQGSSNEQGEVNIFHHVSELLLSFLYKNESDKEMLSAIEEEIQLALEAIEHEWEHADSPHSYVEAFRRLLLAATEWLPTNICNRFELNAEDMIKIGSMIFYDDEFYYLNQEDFSDICQPLLQGVSLIYIKRQLADAGLLVAEGRKRSYWTKETELVTVYGAVIRKRLVKLKREQIDRDGEPMFLELIKMKGEENNGADEDWSDGRYLEDSENCR